MGILCSTFVQINAGTSGRDLLTPEGIWWHPSVAKSNLLVCRQGGRVGTRGLGNSSIGFATIFWPFKKAVLTIRSMLLALLTVCARGTVLIENPDNSIINQHERWQWLARRLRKLGLPVPRWKSTAIISSNVSMFPLPYRFPRMVMIGVLLRFHQRIWSLRCTGLHFG